MGFDHSFTIAYVLFGMKHVTLLFHLVSKSLYALTFVTFCLNFVALGAL